MSFLAHPHCSAERLEVRLLAGTDPVAGTISPRRKAPSPCCAKTHHVFVGAAGDDSVPRWQPHRGRDLLRVLLDDPVAGALGGFPEPQGFVAACAAESPHAGTARLQIPQAQSTVKWHPGQARALLCSPGCNRLPAMCEILPHA